MDEESGHGVGHDVHLPDPSPWPIVAGVAALLLGAALVWWARDSSSEVAAVALGAAAAVALFSVAGWAYEDGRMRMKAQELDAHGAREARYTQVLTFAVTEGQLEAARSEGGVLAAINSRDSALRDLAGFQDLRIIASPAAAGSSQVLVETTWSDREGLATYDETRGTLLDLVHEHQEQVVTGSVQVFDMEVVRDTKDVSVRFGMGAASALIGSLIIGGFFVGAGLTLFESEGTGGGGPGPAPTGFAQTGVMRMADFSFPDGEITLPPGVEFTMRFDNVGAAPHNWSLYDQPDAGDPADGPWVQGCTAGCREDAADIRTPDYGGNSQGEMTFTTPGVGTYHFQCTLHASQMNGKLIVEEGAPLPGTPPPPAAGEGEAEGEGSGAGSDGETEE
jgi:plastocyanin